VFCKNVGYGAPCPNCEEPVTMNDLFDEEMIAGN
jgi:hypothetical protein